MTLDPLVTRFGLTSRETEIVQRHLRGLSAGEMANDLFISPKTVRNHLTNIYHKTNTHTRFALLALAKTMTATPSAVILPSHRR